MQASELEFEVRRAVVGIDDRGLAAPALAAALDIGARLGARVELVHALEHLEAAWIAADEDLLAQLQAAAEKRALEKLEPLLARFEERRGLDAGALRAALSLIPGPAGRVLCEAAPGSRGEVLFLGPHERRGWIDLGRSARRVLVGCRASVWQQPLEYQPIRSILVAVDLAREGHATLAAARELGRKLEAEVSVLHALVPSGLAHLHELAEALAMPEPVVERLRARARQLAEQSIESFDWRGVAHRVELVDEEPRAAILTRQAPDRLVVLGTRGQTGLGALPGNVAWTVMRDARGPVLAVRHPAPRG